MRNISRLLFVSLASLLPLTLSAHPGHGSGTGTDWVHYLSSPIHMGIVVLTLFVLFVGTAYYKRKKDA